METKLTLRLNDNVIERAKKYAQKHKTSLSKMLETYLDSLTNEQNKDKNNTITPLVKSLSGVVQLPADFDYKKNYSEFLDKKYK